MMLTYNNILNDYLMTFRYFGGYYSWQKSKLTRVSNLVSTGFIVDGYNGIKFDAKNKNLVYLSLGLSTVGTLLDFVVSMKSPYKFRKLTSFVSFIINVTRLASSFRKVKEDYNFNNIKLIKRSKVYFLLISF